LVLFSVVEEEERRAGLALGQQRRRQWLSVGPRVHNLEERLLERARVLRSQICIAAEAPGHGSCSGCDMASAVHHCRDCGLYFESSTSLDVHLHYHKENLLSKWANQQPPPIQQPPPQLPPHDEHNNNSIVDHTKGRHRADEQHASPLTRYTPPSGGKLRTPFFLCLTRSRPGALRVASLSSFRNLSVFVLYCDWLIIVEKLARSYIFGRFILLTSTDN